MVALPAGIADRTFRASPRYRLLPSARIPRSLRGTLGNVIRQPEFFGVLSTGGPKPAEMRPICTNTARLIRGLKTAERLPAFVSAGAGPDADLAVIKLVLDDILELGTDHGFVSGLDAYAHLFDSAPAVTPRGRTGRLSIDAVQYGQSLVADHAAALLSARLYRYNTLPATPRQRQRQLRWDEQTDSLRPFAGLGSNQWRRSSPSDPSNDWTGWHRVGSSSGSDPGNPPCKLYVSPACDDLVEALPAAAEILFRSRAIGFKIGRGSHGLLRPDKLVAYFADLQDLGTAARELADALAGVRPHGVPFTASLTNDGLLSWGADPSVDAQALAWEGRSSWRLSITNRLASALAVAARGTVGPIQPWEFALQRLRLDGVDCDRFAPQEDPIRPNGWWTEWEPS